MVRQEQHAYARPAGDLTVIAQWSFADAWVFASIGGTGPDDGCTLTQLIAMADGINHAVLTEAELSRAVPRLVAAGLIGASPQADCYWRTETGQALYERCMKRRGLFGWVEAVPPALARLGEPRDAAWSLPTGAFGRALDAYLKKG